MNLHIKMITSFLAKTNSFWFCLTDKPADFPSSAGSDMYSLDVVDQAILSETPTQAWPGRSLNLIPLHRFRELFSLYNINHISIWQDTYDVIQ